MRAPAAGHRPSPVRRAPRGRRPAGGQLACPGPAT